MRATFSEKDGQFSIVPLDTLALRQDAAALYRAVFGYTGSAYALNPRLLRGLLINGGSAIGAIDDCERMVGFSYGYPGVDNGMLFHYSQATAVAPGSQGTGVGRLLKTAQADIARAGGATSMRWAFDPAVARNAHFNLDTLGARGRWFHPDFYGEPGSDRMIADWALTSGDAPSEFALAARVAATQAVAALPAGPELTTSGEQGGYRWLRFPAAVPSDADGLAAVRAAVAVACERALASGLSALSCRRLATDPDTAVYLFGDDEA